MGIVTHNWEKLGGAQLRSLLSLTLIRSAVLVRASIVTQTTVWQLLMVRNRAIPYGSFGQPLNDSKPGRRQLRRPGSRG